MTTRPWVQLHNLRRAQVLLILPCNAAACVGNYFQAEVYRKSGWNTWREADSLLRDLREEGKVAFAAVDSSILETAPDDPRGAIVLETEMERAKSPDGGDWGAPSWRWFRPTRTGRWTALENLTEALVRGVRRVEGLGIPHVIALVNPRGYFLALAAAVAECGLLEKREHFNAKLAKTAKSDMVCGSRLGLGMEAARPAPVRCFRNALGPARLSLRPLRALRFNCSFRVHCTLQEALGLSRRRAGTRGRRRVPLGPPVGLQA